METDVSLRDYFAKEFQRIEQLSAERDRRYEDRFKASDERTALALASSEKAVTKAETATEKRFDGVNEFRSALSDQTEKLLPRAEAEVKISALDNKVEEQRKLIVILQQQMSEAMGRGAGASALWGYLAGGIGLAIGAVSLIVGILSRFL